VQILEGDAFAFSGVSEITIDEENPNFDVSGDFLMDFEWVTVVRYFGTDSNLTLNCEIEILGPGCFRTCAWIQSFAFESGSKLRRIEARAFADCEQLESICIPATVEILCGSCFCG
jgi:hypothetical protein